MKSLIILAVVLLLFPWAGCEWFGPGSYNLVLEKVGQGETDPETGEYDFEEDASVPIEAKPSAGWEFIRWSENVAEPEKSETRVLMNEDKVVTALFGDDYLGFNEGAIFTYNWKMHYEEEVEPMGEVIVEVLEVDEDKITIEVSNGYEEETTLEKETNSYTTPFGAIESFIVLEEYPVKKGTKGFETIYPGTIMNEPVEAVSEVKPNGLKAWKFYGEDFEIKDYWAEEPPTEKVDKLEIRVVPYKGIVKQLIFFDKESQEGEEHTVVKSVMWLESISYPGFEGED